MPRTSAVSFCWMVELGHGRCSPRRSVPRGRSAQHSSTRRARVAPDRSGCEGGARRSRVRYLDVKESCPVTQDDRPGVVEHGQDHLHPHRRGAAAGDVLLPPDRRRRTPPRRASTSRPATSRCRRRGSSPSSALADDALGRARRAGQDARGQHHQAAQRLRLHPAAQGRDQGAAGAGLRPPRLPGERRRPTRRRPSARSTTRSRAPRSTRCCARATPTAARPRR